MGKLLQSQLTNTDRIKQVLAQINASFELSDGTPVEVLLVYLPCKDGECDLSALYEVIKDCIITDFALSYSEIQKKLKRKPINAPQRLLDKAIERLSQHTAQGELGELMLFTLLDVYFNAPKIVSKISQKQARRMPAFGADAIHAQYKDDQLVLYLGESKLHKDYASARIDAIDSISQSLNTYNEQFSYIESNMNFPQIDDDVEQELLDLLDPFENTSNELKERLHTPCFIGFESPDVFDDDLEKYKSRYIKLACKHIGMFYQRLALKELEHSRTALLLLPVSSIDQLVQGFIDYLEIEE